MQCPSCGATNPESAQWCGQCYRRFVEPAAAPPPTDPAPVTEVHDVVATDIPAVPAPAERTTAALQDSSGAIRREGDRIEWTCPQCEHVNPIELSNCEICGTAFIDRFRQPDEPEPPRNWQAALVMTAVAPGAGHIAIDRYGSGFARLFLFIGWLLGAVALAQSGGGEAMFVIAPMLLGVVVLWAGSLLDIYRLQQGEPEVLAGRPLLWLVVGVLALMGIGLFVSLAAGGT